MNQSQAPEGFFLTPDAVSEETWTILQQWLASSDDATATPLLGEEAVPIPWQMGAQNRRVAQFGFRYDYVKDVVDLATPTPAIPDVLRTLLLQDDTTAYTQCIINEYHPNVLIPWHKDDLEFGPKISVFTFGEGRPLMLRRLREDQQYDTYSVIPSHGFNYIISGSARNDWEHMVPVGLGYRVSFTFRTHKTDPSHDSASAPSKKGQND